jgi:hypothetical protein
MPAGFVLLTLVLIAVLIYVYARYEIARRLVAIAALGAWGAVGLVGVPLVAFLIHFRSGHYFAAAGTIAIGAIVYVPWFVFGFPALCRHLGIRRRH